MKCCRVAVPIGRCLVQFAKIRYVGLTYDMAERCHGLIVIAVFYPDTMHLDEIRVPSLRIEQCMGNLCREYRQMLNLNVYVSSPML